MFSPASGVASSMRNDVACLPSISVFAALACAGPYVTRTMSKSGPAIMRWSPPCPANSSAIWSSITSRGRCWDAKSHRSSENQPLYFRHALNANGAACNVGAGAQP
jgi:hypothetical protein